MGIDINLMLAKVLPWFMYAAMLIIGMLLVVAVGYYLFVIKRRKKWKITLWEQKSNGRLYEVGTDWLVARKFNKGKQTAYILKKNRAETIPPPEECVDFIGGIEKANYLRVLDDYIPLERSIQLPDNYYQFNQDKVTGEKKNVFISNVKDNIGAIKRLTSAQTENRYVFVPLDKEMVGSVKFTPIDYDVNMMRINALDNRDKIYKDMQDWLSKYGHFIAMGGIIVLLIVVMYFSFDFVKEVITQALGAADKVAAPLNDIASRLMGN